MSYTRPAASAANLTWSGATVYTRPAANAANLAFVQINAAAGFCSTNFGAPNALPRAVGFSPTAFGQPLYIGPQFESAAGFNPVSFGLPLTVETGIEAAAAPATQFGSAKVAPWAAGFRPTHLGTPQNVPWAVGFRPTVLGAFTGSNANLASQTGPTAAFGTPTTPTLQTAQAAGFVPIAWGTPTPFVSNPSTLTRTGFAAFVPLSTRMGRPTFSSAVTDAATGATGTTFGAPTARTIDRTLAASATPATTSFGTALLASLRQATPFIGTVLGVPRAGVGASAVGAAPRTRFGAPQQFGPHRGYGINSSNRFGHPRALNRFIHPATHIATTTFGGAASLDTHRATQIPIDARLGRPRLVRSS